MPLASSRTDRPYSRGGTIDFRGTPSNPKLKLREEQWNWQNGILPLYKGVQCETLHGVGHSCGGGAPAPSGVRQRPSTASARGPRPTAIRPRSAASAAMLKLPPPTSVHRQVVSAVDQAHPPSAPSGLLYSPPPKPAFLRNRPTKPTIDGRLPVVLDARGLVSKHERNGDNSHALDDLLSQEQAAAVLRRDLQHAALVAAEIELADKKEKWDEEKAVYAAEAEAKLAELADMARHRKESEAALLAARMVQRQNERQLLALLVDLQIREAHERLEVEREETASHAGLVLYSIEIMESYLRERTALWEGRFRAEIVAQVGEMGRTQQLELHHASIRSQVMAEQKASFEYIRSMHVALFSAAVFQEALRQTERSTRRDVEHEERATRAALTAQLQPQLDEQAGRFNIAAAEAVARATLGSSFYHTLAVLALASAASQVAIPPLSAPRMTALVRRQIEGLIDSEVTGRGALLLAEMHSRAVIAGLLAQAEPSVYTALYGFLPPLPPMSASKADAEAALAAASAALAAGPGGPFAAEEAAAAAEKEREEEAMRLAREAAARELAEREAAAAAAAAAAAKEQAEREAAEREAADRDAAAREAAEREAAARDAEIQEAAEREAAEQRAEADREAAHAAELAVAEEEARRKQAEAEAAEAAAAAAAEAEAVAAAELAAAEAEAEAVAAELTAQMDAVEASAGRPSGAPDNTSAEANADADADSEAEALELEPARVMAKDRWKGLRRLFVDDVKGTIETETCGLNIRAVPDATGNFTVKVENKNGLGKMLKAVAAKDEAERQALAATVGTVIADFDFSNCVNLHPDSSRRVLGATFDTNALVTLTVLPGETIMLRLLREDPEGPAGVYECKVTPAATKHRRVLKTGAVLFTEALSNARGFDISVDNPTARILPYEIDFAKSSNLTVHESFVPEPVSAKVKSKVLVKGTKAMVTLQPFAHTVRLCSLRPTDPDKAIKLLYAVGKAPIMT